MSRGLRAGSKVTWSFREDGTRRSHSSSGRGRDTGVVTGGSYSWE